MPEDSNEKSLPKWCALDSVEDVRRRQMRAVKTAERVMYDAYENGDLDRALTAATRLTQATRAYLKTVEAHEVVDRLDALEDRYDRMRNGVPK
jgi:hypothetical protein